MIPSVINQGDSLDWTESESDYLASDGWVIGYNLVSSSVRINFESTADGDDHSLDLTVATTTAWTPGNYSYQRYATDGTERVTLNNGTVEIKRDFLTAGDERSHAQICVDNIQAVLENRATIDQESYTINGRSLTRMSIDDLLKLYNFYLAKLAKEKQSKYSTIRVRF